VSVGSLSSSPTASNTIFSTSPAPATPVLTTSKAKAKKVSQSQKQKKNRLLSDEEIAANDAAEAAQATTGDIEDTTPNAAAERDLRKRQRRRWIEVNRPANTMTIAEAYGFAELKGFFFPAIVCITSFF
jgi:hypothetical protein